MNRWIVLALVFLFPATAIAVPHQFAFEGSVSRAYSFPATDIPYQPPAYSVGQNATGYLYWNDPADIVVTPYTGSYMVESANPAGPVYWADIYVGGVYFNFNPGVAQVGFNDGTVSDSLAMNQISTTRFDYHGREYMTDLGHMSLSGPGDILSGTSYPDYLDLSLFTSGTISFQIMSLWDDFFTGSIGIDIHNISPVPEPGLTLLTLFGFISLACIRKFRRRM